MNEPGTKSSSPRRKNGWPGPHTALLARLAWSRLQSETLTRLTPTSDFFFEGIIEPFDGMGWEAIEHAVGLGVRQGVEGFNTAPWPPWLRNTEPLFNAFPPARLVGPNLTVSGFHAMRNDSRMNCDMTEIERMRAAISVLSALSLSLENVGHIVCLEWSPGSGQRAFKEFHDRIKDQSRDEALLGTQPAFPHGDIPDLAFRMEKLVLGVAAGPARAPGRALRL